MVTRLIIFNLSFRPKSIKSLFAYQYALCTHFVRRLFSHPFAGISLSKCPSNTPKTHLYALYARGYEIPNPTREGIFRLYFVIPIRVFRTPLRTVRTSHFHPHIDNEIPAKTTRFACVQTCVQSAYWYASFGLKDFGYIDLL
jgi:hypothetical protein